MTRFAEKLQRLEADGRLRVPTAAAGIDFTSNDYLGFSAHPALRRRAIEWIEAGGAAGATGSRLLRGNHPEHEALEDFAAGYFGASRALSFANGFQANHAVFSALAGRRDVVVHDALIHASVREGLRASDARSVKFRHNDLEDCEAALKRARADADVLWLAVESVYSMDGDIAPLAQMHELCSRYGAWLVVDEAHATGVFGPRGRGLCDTLPKDRLVTLHTGGKALGVAGGIVCGPVEIIGMLVNTARPFIYSTAPPPLQAELLRSAMKLSDAEPQHRTRLLELCSHARKVLPGSSETQIFPVVFGADSEAVRAAAELRAEGFDVRPIRPPTVPEGTARLRLSLNAGLTLGDIDALAACLGRALERRAA
jgi:8-amino-7-oxononanoate synthase